MAYLQGLCADFLEKPIVLSEGLGVRSRGLHWQQFFKRCIVFPLLEAVKSHCGSGCVEDGEAHRDFS